MEVTMKRIIMFLVCFLPALSFASDYPKHMVQVTTQGLGIGAGYEKTEPSSDSQFEDFDTFKGNIELNYAYTITPQLQAGGLYSNRSEERNYDTKINGQGELASNTQIMGIFIQWNFREELKDTWYSGLMFSNLNHEEESSNKAVFNKLEDDKNADSWEVYVGRRFKLDRWGISNITFSPSLSFYSQNARKDYADDGLKDNMGVNFQLLKFDVLF